jgi:hypothetical protein
MSFDEDDDDDDFDPRRRDRSPADLRLVQHEVQTNAQRLIELERKFLDLKDVQDQLVNFARRRQLRRRHYKYYVKVLFDEVHP